MRTRGSHRSGRAGLPHPVPQMTTSLRTQSLTANSDCYPLALRLRGVGVRSLRHVSCRRCCHLTRRFPPPGPLGSSSPNSTVLSTRYDFLPPVPPHFVFLRLAVPREHSRFRSRRRRVLRRRAWGWLPGIPCRDFLPWRRQDLPRSWGTLVLMPCSSTPAGSTCQAITTHRRGPRSDHDEGSRIATFEAQSHSFSTGCLRFAGRVTPPPRKTRFRLPARLYRTGFPPAGFQQKVSNSRHVCYPPLPSFRGARSELNGTSPWRVRTYDDGRFSMRADQKPRARGR